MEAELEALEQRISSSVEAVANGYRSKRRPAEAAAHGCAQRALADAAMDMDTARAAASRCFTELEASERKLAAELSGFQVRRFAGVCARFRFASAALRLIRRRMIVTVRRARTFAPGRC